MKYTDIFRMTFSRRGEGVTWEDSSMEEFFMREDNIHEGGAVFSSII